jgi:hypothetical protein
MSEDHPMAVIAQTNSDDDDEFMKSITWCEEDLRRLYPHLVGKSGGFRWFKSPNIVPIERYRKLSKNEGCDE